MPDGRLSPKLGEVALEEVEEFVVVADDQETVTVIEDDVDEAEHDR